MLLREHLIVVSNFPDGRKRDLYDMTIATIDLHTGSRQRLRVFQAADLASETTSIGRDDFNVVLAIKRLQSCQCFCNFHVLLRRVFGVSQRNVSTLQLSIHPASE